MVAGDNPRNWMRKYVRIPAFMVRAAGGHWTPCWGRNARGTYFVGEQPGTAELVSAVYDVKSNGAYTQLLIDQKRRELEGTLDYDY